MQKSTSFLNGFLYYDFRDKVVFFLHWLKVNLLSKNIYDFHGQLACDKLNECKEGNLQKLITSHIFSRFSLNSRLDDLLNPYLA